MTGAGTDDLEAAFRAWQGGLLSPYWITTALDACGLYGPDVDRRCRAEEPAVDRWEAGTLYPTFEQLLALAELTGFPVLFFTRPVEQPLQIEDTTLVLHIKGAKIPRTVLAFTPDAVAATVTAVCPPSWLPHPRRPNPRQPGLW